MEATDNKTLENNLAYLKLTHMLAHYESVARTAAQKQWTHVHYLQEMIGAEARARTDRAVKRRIQLARFPQIKTLEQFSWSWPKKINRPQVQNLFRLNFVKAKENVIFIGNTGLGNYVKHSLM